MSRIGKNPIILPEAAQVTVEDALIRVNGPKGELTVAIPEGFAFEQTDGTLTVSRTVENRETAGQFGLVRTLVDNAVIGVTTGFEKKLEMNGVGYRVEKKGTALSFALGFSHKINFDAPEGVDLNVEGNIITISGADKQQVGQAAAQIRALKKPEPYKGKGIKYVGEHVRRKAGKAAVKGS